MGLMLFESICAQRYDSVFKSTLLRQSHTTRHNHWRGSIPQKKNHAIAKKPFFSVHCWFKYVRSRFSWFFLDEKDSLKGITVFVLRQYVCLHTSRLITNGVNTLTSVSFSARGFKRFFFIPPPQIINE